MTAILGISAFYHDSAAVLVLDGRIVAAAQEERFTRNKHDAGFPVHAIEYCLAEAALKTGQLDHVVFYEKPFLKFERLLETYLAYAPAGFRSFLAALPSWLKTKLNLPREMRRALPGYTHRFAFLEHHESHAASAFFPSPFEEAAILTLDGVGEWATETFGTGRGNKIELTHEVRFPHSLGLLYSAFTYYCGFKVNSGEYKLMGLAPYGSPRFKDTIFKNLIDLKEDGSFRLDMAYFNYGQGLTMTGPRFHELFGRAPRGPETPLDEFHMDIAASIQAVTEEAMLRAARFLRKETGLKNLCLAGGVALNCVGNGSILEEGIFDEIWIQPAAGDAGGALGAALFVWHRLLDKPRAPEPSDSMRGALLGPAFNDTQIRAFLLGVAAKYELFDNDEALCERVSALLAAEKVVGWFQGRMEFGPRALGSRSILGDARSATMQSVMNRKIKFRESFRPFAPVATEERVRDYFDLREGCASPYMLLVANVKPELRKLAPEDEAKLLGLEKLAAVRSELPAITHVDYSARIQTADAKRHGPLHKLLRAFEARTGCGVLVNTSFNVRGEPLVCTPEDAWRCFMATNMDVLAMGRCVLLKEEQPQAKQHEIDEHLAKFDLD